MEEQKTLLGKEAGPPPAYCADVGAQPAMIAPSTPAYQQAAGYQYNYGSGQTAGNTHPAAAYTSHSHVTVVHAAPRDYMALAALAMCFCWPLALFALFKSCESQEALRQGDIPRAAMNGDMAKRLAIGAIITGCVIVVVAVVINFALISAATD